MDFNKNKDEIDFFTEEKKNEANQSEHHFNNLDKLNDARNEVTNNFNENRYNSNSTQTIYNNVADSITLTLDPITMKNIRFIATAIKVFSVLGIISGVFQILFFFIGVFTIIISLKFFKSATALEEAIFTKNENKLKLYFSEQATGLKLYIIFIIVSIVLVIIVYGFIFSAILNEVRSYNSY
mgnify:CR=1 FL=1